MNDDDTPAVEIEGLRAEHRRIDCEIKLLVSTGSADQIEIARLKKRKLRLKDQIQQLADAAVPDIIA